MKLMDEKCKRLNFRDESGFTLMELIVVIGIIIILIALLVPRFSGMTDKANAAAAQNDARIGLTALAAYVVGTDVKIGGTLSADTMINEINKALGGKKDGDNYDSPHGVTVNASRDGIATIGETRSGLTFTMTINARQSKITKTACSGDKGRCDSLNDAGLLINGVVSN